MPAAVRFVIWAAFLVAVDAAEGEETLSPQERVAAFRAAVCSRGYSLDCLKLDLVGLVARTGGGGRYQLLPGVFFTHNLTAVPPTEDLVRAVKDGTNATQQVEGYIASTVNDYLSSVTLSIKVLDSNTMSHARHISEQILTSVVPLETGRKKGYGYGGALWAAGTLAAVGLAALAAISGKAMMASMLALMMAGTTALRSGNGNGNGNGGGGCKTHYIDAHARAMELERLASVEPVEAYSQPRPVFNRPHEEIMVQK